MAGGGATTPPMRAAGDTEKGAGAHLHKEVVTMMTDMWMIDTKAVTIAGMDGGTKIGSIAVLVTTTDDDLFDACMLQIKCC